MYYFYFNNFIIFYFVILAVIKISSADISYTSQYIIVRLFFGETPKN